MLIPINPAQVDHAPIGGGDRLKERPLRRAIAAPDPGDDEDLHLAGEAFDQGTLRRGQGDTFTGPLPGLSASGIGGEVGRIVIGRFEGAAQESFIHGDNCRECRTVLSDGGAQPRIDEEPIGRSDGRVGATGCVCGGNGRSRGASRD